MRVKRVLASVWATIVMVSTALAQPYGAGPGMMGGSSMGPGMMGGGFGFGMGPGMMFGCSNDDYAGLDLSPEQQKAIAGIQEQTSKAMWQHMGTMHGQGYRMHGMFGPGPLDEPAMRKSSQTMTETQKAMFELQLDARKKVDAVLTKDQREKLGRHWSGR